jgi:hypothetical protein
MFEFANETARRVNRTHVTSFNGRRTNKKAILCDVTVPRVPRFAPDAYVVCLR